MTINVENNCFITLKDHKENFLNNPTTRLINPAKNELGRISKVIIENINTQLRNIFKLNRWKSTVIVIKWLKNMDDRKRHKFMMFGVKDFYLSISKKLLTNAIKFAKRSVLICRKKKDTIFYSRRSLLFNNGDCCMKKGNNLFDVTMDIYDAAEVCEMVACFILSLRQNTRKGYRSV